MTLVLSLADASGALAQGQDVPPQFQPIYNSLNTELIGFNGTLGQSTGSATLFTGNLKNADSNAGPQLVNSGTWPGIMLQLQELQSMGVRAVMVEVGFPMLYEPFLTSQGVSYSQFVSFYQQIATSIKAAGLKLIVENDTLLTGDVQAGWDAAPFYATLDWTQYQQARAQTALTIAQVMQPDYIVVLQEPTTEANNSGQTIANTPSGSYSLLSQILASISQAGVPGMQVGAGAGTSQANVLQFIQQYVTLPLNFIDIHIYPINFSYLTLSLQIASIASAAGLPVSMTECWLWKVMNSELGVLTTDQIRARDPFSFWAPLDAYFLQTMQNLAGSTKMLFMDPFGSDYFAAYLPYDDSTENLSPTDILNEEGSQASQNLQQAIFTSTAMSYYASLVSPPDKTPPSVPAGLSGISQNPATVKVSWSGSTDNVGVAGYNVLRNGTTVGTTANTYYVDSGLTGSTTYAYSVEAFDLAGNLTAPAAGINVTTRDGTPPSVPGNVAVTAISCERATLTWSPSTDNEGIRSYLVFWGLSPDTMAQVGRTAANTKFDSYPLTAGTTYYYGVEAQDTSGNLSAMSAIVSVTTPFPPSAPVSLTATPQSATKIALSWPTAVSGGLPIQKYQVFGGTAPTSLNLLATVLQTSYTDKSPIPGGTYYYAVAAVDTGGDASPQSPVVSATTPGLPYAPSNLVAIPYSATKIGLAWWAAASGGLPVEKYFVYRGGMSTNLTQLAVVTQTSFTDITAVSGTQYYYAVAAADSAGDMSPMSAPVAVTAPWPPQAPANLVATAISTTKIGLSWSAAVSGGLVIKTYRVWAGPDAGSLVQIATVYGTSYNQYGLIPGTTYYYGVEAVDTGGDVSAMSAIASATTVAPPSAPAGLTVTPQAPASLALAWQPAIQGTLPVQKYHVYRGVTSSVLTDLGVTLKTSYTDTTVVSGSQYYYAVAAVDTAGNLSPQSAPVAATAPTSP